MLEAPPFRLLVRMAGPNAMAFLVQASVTMAEAWYVAQIGTSPLAAIALMFPALMLMQMLANGAMGGGVSSAVARALGAGDRARADALVWHALVIAVGAGILFFLIFATAGEWLLWQTGAPDAVTREAIAYGEVLFAGTVPIWTSALLSAVVRGSGNMKLPALLMIVAAVVQIPISGALILGAFGMPGLGLPGAAVAVIVVSTLTTLILLVYLARRSAAPRLARADFRLKGAHFAAIFHVGLLASLSPVFVVLTIMLVNVLVSGFGVSALAGYGIVARLEFLLVPLVFGLGSAMTALVGINVGAGQVARAERIGWIGAGSAAALTGVVGFSCALAPWLWLDLFTTDAASWASGASYLVIVGPAFLFQGIGLSLYFASQGAGTVIWPVVATVLRFVVAVGFAWVGVRYYGQSLGYLYGCITAGMVIYGVITAGSVYFGAWRRAALHAKTG
jgi:putative MATE family efflux protein